MHLRRPLAQKLGIAAATLAIAAFGCNALTGIDDLIVGQTEAEFTSDGGDTSTIDSDGATSNPSPRDAEPLEDSAPPPPPPTCTCVPTPPQDWIGPLSVQSGSDEITSCPAGLIPVYAGGTAPVANPPCTPCKCAEPTNACAIDVTTSSGPGCGGSCGSVELKTEGCSNFKHCPTLAGVSTRVATVATDDGSCKASGGGRVTARWTERATACAFAIPPKDSCAAEESCAPESATTPDATVCIIQSGDVACPDGAYTERSVFYTDIDDTRSCSACACGAPQGTCKPGSARVYDDNGCTGTNRILEKNACPHYYLGLAQGSAKWVKAPEFEGSCTPQGGVVVDGGIEPKNATTLCCLKLP